MCVYYMTGTPEGSTKSWFMVKLGIEPATPGLQGIALIHYTTTPPFSGKPLTLEGYFFRINHGCITIDSIYDANFKIILAFYLRV